MTFNFFLLFFDQWVPCFVLAAVFVFARSQLQIFSVSQIVVVVVLACSVFAFAVIFFWPYLVYLALLGRVILTICSFVMAISFSYQFRANF